MIREDVTIVFDPVKEYREMRQFERDNDMRDWIKIESTTGFAYTRTKTIWTGVSDEQSDIPSPDMGGHRN